MSGPDRPIQPDNRIEARRWLSIVEEDIDVAIAAEPFRRTHDLDDLAARLVPVYPQFAVQAAAVRRLSIWGIAYRYPGLKDVSEPLPEIEELERMIDLLQGSAGLTRGLIDEE